jgi:signal transduction histidine kinase
MKHAINGPLVPSDTREELHELIQNSQQNNQKITLHGKRADNIVKSLLQHARSGSNEATMFDINTLIEENLNLCYHNITAKDKNFSARINTRLDHTIDQLNIVPQDISRLLSNLYENAFYALHQKWRNNPSFMPQIDVRTRKEHNKVRIIIKDNGTGIPEKIINKIYQPFFTTKPTGEGTGLGLSLSFDIVKAHRGEMQVHSREGEYTEFVIDLPV